ncbi:MAG: MEDS domain-containing protein [Candidatus Eisenbacteria bacterium]|nr:MEDS domain-containing protein [Candidatus Eisenbacteria bacterium]
MNPHPVRTIGDLRLGNHATFLYQNEPEHRNVMTRFVRQGLERGEKVIYVADSHTPETVSNYLRSERVDVDSHLDRRRLVFLTSSETYLRRGVFDSERMRAMIVGEAERALAEGFAGLRGTGEMTWARGSPGGSEKLIEYERALSELAEKTHVLMVCQYDRSSFRPEFLLDILHIHPLVIVGTEVCENFYYIAPAELEDHYLPAARFRVCIENLLVRKRMEESVLRSMEQLRHSQKMEAVGKVAGGVAHDFRNLVTAIMQSAELLEEEFPPGDQRREDAQKILSAADRAAQLVTQLLAFGMRQELKPRMLDLNSVVGSLENMLKRVTGDKVELVLLLEPELGAVKADQSQLEQVLMNMVVNAREAMPDGGRLTVRTDNVTLEPGQCRGVPEARPGKFVRLSIADTGIGMGKDVLEQMFEPFFTTKQSGTGLGLSVAYGIIRQHGGWITVDSEPGRGTRFQIYLPAIGADRLSAARTS